MELPVQFRDIDCLSHVNSATFFQYMETARIELVRTLGQIVHGFRPLFIVASGRCDYLKPIVDERKVTVYVWVSRLGGSSWDFDYSICSLNGTLFAIGRTTQVAYDYDKRASTPITDGLRRDLGKYKEEPLAFRGR